MKNKINLTLLRLHLISLIVLSSITYKAQIAIGFQIINNNGMCPVTLDYKVFDTTTCATVCFGTNITINPVTSYAIPGSCITGAEDIEIILSVPSSVPVNYGFGVGGGGAWNCYNSGNPATVTDSGTGGCFGTGGWTILVSYTNATIW